MTHHTPWELDEAKHQAIDGIFARFTAETPGCAVGVYRGDQVVFSRGYGMSNLEHDIPITPESIFHVASISKQFTAMCIALLHHDGRLNVDDPVQKYIPELPTYDHPITIRHLLHHVSGIRDQWTMLRLCGFREEDLVTEADCFDLVRRQRETNFPPNDMYMYSNSGYTMMAMIVKSVTGRTLRQFAHERIFQPLGMTNTHFHDDHAEIVPGRTQAYVPKNESGFIISIPVFDVVGTTSLFTTVEDFAKWNANFATGTVGGEMLAEMQSPGTFNDGSTREYGWGLEIKTWRGQHRVGHDGADHGYRACYFRLPDLDFGVTVFTNLSTGLPRELAESVADIVLGDLLEPVTAPTGTAQPPVPANSLAGAYTGPVDTGLETHLILDEEGGHVRIHLGDEPEGLVAADDNTYTLQQGYGKVWVAERDDSGTATTVQVQIGSGSISTCSRVGTFTEPRTEAFTGRYHCPELDIAIEIARDAAGGLLWQQRKLGSRACVRLDATILGMSSLGASQRLEFDFGDDGNATGFRLSAGRVRNLKFNRT